MSLRRYNWAGVLSDNYPKRAQFDAVVGSIAGRNGLGSWSHNFSSTLFILVPSAVAEKLVILLLLLLLSVLLTYLSLAQLSMVLRMTFIAFGWNNSSGRRGVLSSNTKSACHFEPKTVNCNKIGRASLPFSVSVQRTIMGDFFPSSMHWMNPSFSSSFKRIDRTLGVKRGMELRSWLNLSTPRIPMSLSISIVHFFPNTPKLVLMGHWANFTSGRSHSEMAGYLFFFASSENDFCNYAFTPLPI